MSKQFKSARRKKRRAVKSNAPEPAKRSPDEIREEIARAARAGAELVSERSKLIQETSIGVVERGVLDDVAQTALQVGQANLAGIMANCRFCVMAAWQLGYSGERPDFLPGEAVARIVATVKDIPQEDQERNVTIAASLGATAFSKTLTTYGQMSSARVHVWVAYLFGKDRRMMEAGAS